MSSSGVASWGALAISVVCGFLLQKCSSVRALNSACRWCVVRGELVVLVVSFSFLRFVPRGLRVWRARLICGAESGSLARSSGDGHKADTLRVELS